MLVYAHLLALSHILGKDNLIYLGPESATVELAKIVKQAYYIKKSSKIQKLKAVATQRNYTTLGVYFDECKKEIVDLVSRFSSYVWVEFSKTGHLIKELSNKGCTIICYAHNYEHDYYKISEKGLYNVFRNAIRVNEKLTCDYSNLILGDYSYLQLIKEEYKNDNLQTLPFFSYKDVIDSIENPKKSVFKYLILSGSFAYGHNFAALEQVLEAWSKIKHNTVYLGLCGSGMEAIKPYLKNAKNLIIFNKPWDEYPIIKEASLYLNPFVSNTGVLTRNLVAMSAGKAIVGLVESFKGYSLENMKEVVMCGSITEIIHQSIEATENSDLLSALESNTINTFNKVYSFQPGRTTIEALLKEKLYS
ncbi:MAG: hypothetical protein AAGU01_03055 [Clostridiaceae bacterium]